jgi:hypothetical protein
MTNSAKFEDCIMSFMEIFGIIFNMNSPQRIVLLFLALAAGVLSFIYFPRYHVQKLKTQRLAQVLSAQDKKFSLDQRIKFAACQARDSLPDHDCTPGDVFPEATLDTICTPGYTKTVRNVPAALRQSVYAEYGVAYPQPRGSYELDHLIPLALGGNNSIANLFPQEAEPVPGFREKDVVEVYLQQQACAGRVALSLAQEQIATNWLDVYNNLAPEDIQRIKTQFRNWSN